MRRCVGGLDLFETIARFVCLFLPHCVEIIKREGRERGFSRASLLLRHSRHIAAHIECLQAEQAGEQVIIILANGRLACCGSLRRGCGKCWCSLWGSHNSFLLFLFSSPFLLVPFRDCCGDFWHIVWQFAKQQRSNILVGVQLLRHFPVLRSIGLPRCQFDIPKQQVYFEHVGPLRQNVLSHFNHLVFLTISPEGFNQSNVGIESFGLLGHHAAKFLDGLREHIAPGVESGQAGPTQAELRVFTSPRIYIEAKELRAQLGHVGFDFQSLLKFVDGSVEFSLAFVGYPDAHMRRDIFRVGSKHSLKRGFGLFKLTVEEVCFSKNTVGFKVVGNVFKDMLNDSNRFLGLVFLKQLLCLIICCL